MDDSFTRVWERQVNEFLQQPVPDEITTHGQQTVVDICAAIVAGSAIPSIASVTDAIKLGRGEASVLGSKRRVQPEQAALLNTAAAIAQEIEEGHNTGGHVGASIVASGLPVAETEAVDGETFVAHCIRVYEICVRLERALFAMKDKLNEAVPWLLRNPHSTWTTVGPALITALCRGATPTELKETFRIAANLAVVSMHDPYAEGAPARNFTAGFSAQAGVSAAHTGLAGLQGSQAAIEQVYDPFDELLEGGFTSSFDTLGEHWEITEQYLKPYPSCRYTHPPLDALRDAMATGERKTGKNAELVADIERIWVKTFENATEMSHTEPETITGAKFSTPYVLARYLLDDEITLDSFTEEKITDESVRTLAGTVSLETSGQFEKAFPESWGASVKVELADGTELTGECAYPRGDYRKPLSKSSYHKRNRRLLAEGLPANQVEPALTALAELEIHPIRATVAHLIQ